MANEPKCPFPGVSGTNTVAGSRSNADWWPKQLRYGNSSRSANHNRLTAFEWNVRWLAQAKLAARRWKSG